MALKEESGGSPWFAWESDLIARKSSALARCRDRLATSMRYHQFIQYVFYGQWKSLRKRCAESNIGLIGDIPIFVAHDSADVWARPDLFFLDKKGRPTCVSGVPPDFFSRTGQLWGNPLYRWDVHEQEGFAWWINRLNVLLGQVDMIRIDHFRGLEAYWEVPGKAKTAVNGRWVPGPGAAFFRALQHRFVDLPLIAEDLGMITPAVEALRDQFQLPGMRILQFGFNSSLDGEKHLPHRFVPHCLVYTGTHDNDTAVGWLKSAQVQSTQSAAEVQAERAYALRYLGTSGDEFHWDMIRLAFSSIADIAIVPHQDILGLDSRARMNIPGKAEGNWSWRFRTDQLSDGLKQRLADLTATYSRWNGTPPDRLDPHHVPATGRENLRPKSIGEVMAGRRRRGQVKTGTKVTPPAGSASNKRGPSHTKVKAPKRTKSSSG
jgi:4-alpha-glucanotransferase